MSDSGEKNATVRAVDAALKAAALARRAFPHGAGSELRPAQLQVLLLLWRRTGLTTNEIAETLAVNQTTASHAVAALERLELVRQTRDGTGDARVRNHDLTPAGELLATATARRIAAP